MLALLGSLRQKGIYLQENASTAALCSFRIGGPCLALARPKSRDELVFLIRTCMQAGQRFILVGRGSNLLFDDPPLHALVISTSGLTQVRVCEGEIEAECGASLIALSTLAAKHGLGGLEFACGIPGSVGGGLYMNAGAHGSCMLNVLKSANIYDPVTDKIRTVINHELNNDYRKSDFQINSCVILSARLSLLPHQDPLALQACLRDLRAARRLAQPLEFPSAGCCFRRPYPNAPLGKFLDELGVKGMRVGDAAVSKKHAAFIVNLGAARAIEVRTLMTKIQNKAKEERGIILEPELCMIRSET